MRNYHWPIADLQRTISPGMSSTQSRPTVGMLAEISGLVAGAFRRAFGRGPIKTVAHWAGRDVVVVLMEDGHTDAERSLRSAGHAQALIEGRRLLQRSLEEELKRLVERATDREVITVLSSTRVDPDISAEIFVLREASTDSERGIKEAANAARTRAEELHDETHALDSPDASGAQASAG